jgi:hypothetical protein
MLLHFSVLYHSNNLIHLCKEALLLNQDQTHSQPKGLKSGVILQYPYSFCGYGTQSVGTIKCNISTIICDVSTI